MLSSMGHRLFISTTQKNSIRALGEKDTAYNAYIVIRLNCGHLPSYPYSLLLLSIAFFFVLCKADRRFVFCFPVVFQDIVDGNLFGHQSRSDRT